MEIPISALLAALGFSIILFLTILFVSKSFELKLLDGIANPKKVRAALKIILEDKAKKNAHIWITATLDVAFPFSYGFLFAASAIRFFHNYGAYLAIPAVLAIITDLIEGGIQLLALTGTTNFIELKKYVTPLKFILSVLGLIIALVGFLKESLNPSGIL